MSHHRLIFGVSPFKRQQKKPDPAEGFKYFPKTKLNLMPQLSVIDLTAACEAPQRRNCSLILMRDIPQFAF